uniref:Uncharacterized protein n=1 Tax=Davidia involucrata TaxID=16924 RepID=A0A5B7C0S7_DAVIN
MGSEYNPSKPHYNISMSKRTRKPQENQIPLEEKESPPKDVNELVEENDHRSLKQLMIKGDGEGRSSLGQHFTEEEKQLQVVVKQHEESLDGVKFKRLVSRYARVLSHLIKIKGGPPLGSRKKPVLRLSM